MSTGRVAQRICSLCDPLSGTAVLNAIPVEVCAAVQTPVESTG